MSLVKSLKSDENTPPQFDSFSFHSEIIKQPITKV